MIVEFPSRYVRAPVSECATNDNTMNSYLNQKSTAMSQACPIPFHLSNPTKQPRNLSSAVTGQARELLPTSLSSQWSSCPSSISRWSSHWSRSSQLSSWSSHFHVSRASRLEVVMEPYPSTLSIPWTIPQWNSILYLYPLYLDPPYTYTLKLSTLPTDIPQGGGHPT